MDRGKSLAHVLLQETERPLAGRAGRRAMPGGAPVAVESVTCARIGEYLDEARIHRRLDLGDVADRNAAVLLTEVEHDRTTRLLAERAGDHAAVVADGACKAGNACRREPGQRPTPAVADNRHLAGR